MVGLADQCVQLKGRLIGPGKPHGHVMLVLLNTLAQRLDVFLKALPGQVPEQSHELVTAGAVDPGGLQSLLQQSGAMADQPVTCVVPQRIVGLLETGNVTGDHAQLTQTAQTGILLEHSVHGVAVVKIGKRVVVA